jgi:hypothetical protein
LKVYEIHSWNPGHLKLKEDNTNFLSNNSFGTIEILTEELEEIVPRNNYSYNFTATEANTLSLLINPNLADFSNNSYLILAIDSTSNGSSDICAFVSVHVSTLIKFIF